MLEICSVFHRFVQYYNQDNSFRFLKEVKTCWYEIPRIPK